MPKIAKRKMEGLDFQAHKLFYTHTDYKSMGEKMKKKKKR